MKKTILALAISVAGLFVSAGAALAQNPFIPDNAFCRTQGCIPFRGPTLWTGLAAGSNGQVLMTKGPGANPEWFTVTGIGTVTSAGLSMPALFNVANSPITAAGTLAVTLATQAAHAVWAGPTTGSPATPTFRALIAADIPAIPISGLTGLGTGVASALAANVTGSGGIALKTGAALITPAIGDATGTSLILTNTPASPMPVPTTVFNPIAALFIAPADNAATVTTPGTHIPSLVDIENSFGGSNINDGRNGLGVYQVMTAPSDPASTYRYYAGVNILADAFTNDNGAPGDHQGFHYGLGAVARLGATATYWKALIGAEFNVAADAGSSVEYKAILSLGQWPEDKEAGSVVDSYIWATRSAGAVGAKTFLQLDAIGGDFPVVTTGTILKASGGTVANAMDFSGLTSVTGFLLTGPGIVNLSSTAASSSTITGALRVAGGVGVAGNLFAGAIGTTGDAFIGGVVHGNQIGIGMAPASYSAAVFGASGIIQAVASDGVVTQVMGYANATAAFAGTISNHPYFMIVNNIPIASFISSGLDVTGVFNASGQIHSDMNMDALSYTASGSAGVSCSVGTLNPLTAIVVGGIITSC